MISKQQFQHIKGGDVLLFNSGVIRTVLQGPVDLVNKRGPWTPSVSFTKMNRSYIHNPVTVYFWPDVRLKIKAVIGKCKSVCLKSEVLRLKQIGFDPRSEFDRIVKNEISESKRRGWKTCCRVKKLAA